MVLYKVLCERMEELIQMLRDYKAPYNSTQPVAAIIIDEQNNVIARNVKSLDVTNKRYFGKMMTHMNVGIIHAEQRVLEEAGRRARGKILITTLEPCTWRKSGKSCSDLILERGIVKVVYGYPEPFKSLDSENYLRDRGVEVTNLKEYTEQIAQLTNAHIGLKRKKRIEKLQKQGWMTNQEEREREFLKSSGELGRYNRAYEKRELDRLLRHAE